MKNIISFIEPSIELDELTIPELASESDFEDNSKKVGSYAPFVVINTVALQVSNLIMCEIDCDDFLPKITLVIREMRGFIANEAFPMDGDIIQVYMKSKNPDFKPIRADFRITGTDSTVDGIGDPDMYTIEGILNLPEIFVDKIKSFGKTSTMDVLKVIAKDLDLGFATNASSTVDTMGRICCDTSYYDFIQEELVPTCYKDDNSFFECHIDPWYNIVLIEMNELLSKEHDADKFTKVSIGENYFKNSPVPDTEAEDFVLQNRSDGWNQNYFSAYTMHSNSGAIFTAIGYRNYMKFYDKTDKKLKEFYLESLSTPGTKANSKIQKGRDNEDHTKLIRNFYVGDQFTDNVHKNYYFAKLNNYINNLELEKTTIGLTVSNYNPLVIKGQVVPVIIFNKDAMKKVADSGESDGVSINETFTGDYVVRGIKYCYSVSASAYYTRYKLARREFLKPKWQRA